MQQTTNYKLNKIELSDSPADITVLNGNWDTIDTNLKKLSDEKFDKKGGTVSGTVTITGKLIASGGAELNGNVTFNDPIIGKTSFLATVDAVKGTAPSAQKSFHIGFYDKNGFGIPANRLARIQYTLGTDNNPQMSMLVNRPNEGSTEDPVGVIAQWIGNTSARISVTHHPSTDSNDKQVATTYWVRNLKATASQYGLVKLADETAILNESDESALTVDKAYELNDFRRMETTYAVGDKVNCAFNFGLFLECTTAGTTSDDTLDTRNVTHGQVITDGTCQWTVRTHVKSVNGNVSDASGNIAIEVQAFPSGTQLLFYQASAPTGWTKVTGIGNRVIKIVEDETGGTTGGSSNFSDVFKSLNTGSATGTVSGTTSSTKISINQMPAHNHSLELRDREERDEGKATPGGGAVTTTATNNTGGSQGHTHTFSATVSSHSHTVNLNVKYINVIVCKKD